MGILIQMAGFPGSGKSTLAYKISNYFDAIVLDRDIIKNSMLEAGIEGEVLAKASYRVVFEMARNYLNNGKNVIIDTPCFYQETIDYGYEICKGSNSEYRYIECIVDDYSVIETRLRTRNRLNTQITGTTKEKYYQVYDKSVKPQDIEVLTLDTSDISRLNYDTLLKYLMV